MQINGFHNNIKDLLKTKGNTEDACRRGVSQKSFSDSFQKKLYPESNGNAMPPEACDTKSGHISMQDGRAIAEKERSLGKNNTFLRVENAEQALPAENTGVRHISYEQCDKIQINIIDGFTLKAKLEEENGSRKIYVEAKYDDGREEAYLFDGEKVSGESGNPIEKIAYVLKNERDAEVR